MSEIFAAVLVLMAMGLSIVAMVHYHNSGKG